MNFISLSTLFAFLTTSTMSLLTAAQPTSACETSLTAQQLQTWTHRYVPRGSNGRGAAAAYYLVGENGNVERKIYALNRNHPQAVASTQKMVTAYTAYHLGSLGTKVAWTSVDQLYDRQGDPAFLRSTGAAPKLGQSAAAADYLQSLIEHSSNGAALAISQSTKSGSIREFVDQMNQTAHDLIGSQTEIYNTYFQNPAGLTDSGGYYDYASGSHLQQSTADNMAMLMGKIMSDRGFRSTLARNGLPYFANGVVLKPGETHAAGDTEIVYIPLPGCESKALAYAVFGEESNSQWSRYHQLLSVIKSSLKR